MKSQYIEAEVFSIQPQLISFNTMGQKEGKMRLVDVSIYQVTQAIASPANQP
jgi:hypothetical protein